MAFSWDGAVPGHTFWHRINPRTRTPTNPILVRRGLRLPLRSSLSEARPAVGVVFLYAGIFWLVSARKLVQGTEGPG